MIDLIGDIHGHADKLEALLQKLGYKQNEEGVYGHPLSKVIFVGDYIDRGPKIRQTLQIVKSMVDSGNAIALMGNHEYNALCFDAKDMTEGGHLRKHTISNIVQHIETLVQFKGKEKEYKAYLDWFKTLPLYYETASFRVVHACWDSESIAYLRETLVNDRLTDDLLIQSVDKNSSLYQAIEITLKGKELELPKGVTFKDKDNKERSQVRIKWWENPSELTLRSFSVELLPEIPDEPIDMTSPNIPQSFYDTEEKNVFFGHYWMKGEPTVQKPNVCCLDYSVAKGGKLVSYRLGEETELTSANLSCV